MPTVDHSMPLSFKLWMLFCAVLALVVQVGVGYISYALLTHFGVLLI